MRPTASGAHANVKRQRLIIAVPAAMKGLLRPHFDVQRSAVSPTSGWTIKPVIAPDIDTRASRDFGSPSSRRNGVVYMSWMAPQNLYTSQDSFEMCKGRKTVPHCIPNWQHVKKTMRSELVDPLM